MTEGEAPVGGFLRPQQIPFQHDGLKGEHLRNGLAVPPNFQRRPAVARKPDLVGVVLGKGFVQNRAFEVIPHKAVVVNAVGYRRIPAEILAEHGLAQLVRLLAPYPNEPFGIKVLYQLPLSRSMGFHKVKSGWAF